MAIISNPLYKTLGFEPPFVMNSEITNFVAGTVEGGETTNLSMVRITLRVRSSQNERASEATLLADAITTVQLALTEQGYQYEYITP
jgi:hypothetical protein